MSKAIIDTTVLTDILLNSGETKKNALKALSFFGETLLPVYAIKEFKAGPLKNIVWMHNKLVSLGSFSQALDALQKMSRTPKRYTTSTAIQALREASGSIASQTIETLEKKYGKRASIDQTLCDEFRLTLKSIIMRAWKKRRNTTTSVIHPLPCYREISPIEKRGLLELEPKRCNLLGECSLAPLIRDKLLEINSMRDAILYSDKMENQRRAKTMRQICRTPNRTITDADCANLGDAIFVLICPNDAEILTTNIVDYLPLANAVGKKAISPRSLSDLPSSSNLNLS